MAHTLLHACSSVAPCAGTGLICGAPRVQQHACKDPVVETQRALPSGFGSCIQGQSVLLLKPQIWLTVQSPLSEVQVGAGQHSGTACSLSCKGVGCSGPTCVIAVINCEGDADRLIGAGRPSQACDFGTEQPLPTGHLPHSQGLPQVHSMRRGLSCSLPTSLLSVHAPQRHDIKKCRV